ncbi:hypothetical protein NKG05_14720 [Oerskovia sp. M15]
MTSGLPFHGLEIRGASLEEAFEQMVSGRPVGAEPEVRQATGSSNLTNLGFGSTDATTTRGDANTPTDVAPSGTLDQQTSEEESTR